MIAGRKTCDLRTGGVCGGQGQIVAPESRLGDGDDFQSIRTMVVADNDVVFRRQVRRRPAREDQRFARTGVDLDAGAAKEINRVLKQRPLTRERRRQGNRFALALGIAGRPRERAQVVDAVQLLLDLAAPFDLVEKRDAFLRQLFCFSLIAKTIEEFADDIEQFRPNFRAIGELDADSPGSRFQHLACRQLLRLFDVAGGRQIGAENIDEKVFHGFRFCSLGLGELRLLTRDHFLIAGFGGLALGASLIAFRLGSLGLGIGTFLFRAARFVGGTLAFGLGQRGLFVGNRGLPFGVGALRNGRLRLPKGGCDSADQQQRRDRHRGDGGAIAVNELAPAVAEGIRACHDRAVSQIGVEVGLKSGDGSVTLGGQLAQRLGKNIVEVATQLAAKPLRRAAEVFRNARRILHGSNGEIGRCGRGGGFDDVAGQPGGRRISRSIGAVAAEQAVKHHPERVNVGAGGDDAAFYLLGRRVFWCHSGAIDAGQGRVFGRACIAMQQLGDTKIEQLDRAVVLDKDVGGFEITVDDEVGVRIGNGAADLIEQTDAGIDVEATGIAIAIDAFPADVLEHQIASTIRQDADIQQARNVGVGEARQDLTFTPEAFQRQFVGRGVMEHLDRDLAFEETVITRREPHPTHAAGTEAAEYRPGSDRTGTIIATVCRCLRGERTQGRVYRGAIKKASALRFGVGADQFLQAFPGRGFSTAKIFELRCLLGFRQVEPAIEQRQRVLRLLRGRRIRVRCHYEAFRKKSSRNALALRQSRFTVGSDTSSTSATSSSVSPPKYRISTTRWQRWSTRASVDKASLMSRMSSSINAWPATRVRSVTCTSLPPLRCACRSRT